MAPLSIVFVPGFWEGTSVFDPLREILSAEGIDTYVAPLRSTGTTSPGSPTMNDDIAGVQEVITRLVKEDGKRLLVVGHSAGGLISAAATEGLETTDPSKPGVHAFYFITAGVFPVGFAHKDLPFMDFQGGKMYCHDPEKLLFNDVPAEVTAKYLPLMQNQPGGHWNEAIQYVGWDKVPSTYLKCTADACLPLSYQEHFAETIKGKVDEVALGHMAFLASPRQIADKLLAAVKQQ